MQIQTQQFLASLDSNKRDKGLSARELKALDRDGDGRLSGAETGHLVNDRDLEMINRRLSAQSQVKASLSFLGDNFGNDFAVFSRSELNTELFPGGASGISVHDVRQNGVGDCYYMAAMASLAQQRPQAIVDMISDNGNGTYTVKLPGADRAVTVDKPTPEELSKFALPGSNGSTWAAVLEKAFARYTNTDRWFPKSNERESIESGLLSTGIHPLTGHGTNTDILATTFKSTTRNRLSEAMRNHKVVTASVNSLFGGKKKESQNNLPAQHVYSIVSYDRNSDKLRIRNPWGAGSDAKNLKFPDADNDGVFTMTMDEFYEYFSFIGYEEGQ